MTNHAVKNEPGTLVYVPAQDPKDPNKVTIWEEVSARPMAVIDLLAPWAVGQATYGSTLRRTLSTHTARCPRSSVSYIVTWAKGRIDFSSVPRGQG